jgi:hypothetical protein
MLVVLEGVDGVGKSTIAESVRKAFTLNNVILCSDPCKQHPASLAIRQYVLARAAELPVSTQVELFKAARLILWHDIIKPALDDNALIICDRLWLSTWVYQGTEVEPIPKIDICTRMKKRGIDNHWDVPEVGYLKNLDSKYRSAISKGIDKGAIGEAILYKADDLQKTTKNIVQDIVARKSGLMVYDRDFSYPSRR